MSSQNSYTDDGENSSGKSGKASNVLPLWGNERTMNLNNLILTNIQSSHYFKVNLYELKTYHEVVDEIYYKVQHLEPWEKGSRRTSGQTGMCGGVRGVGAGGIVSTAYCLLYKLFTLKLTRKQLNGLITHCDSPYIRALGFMYIRYVLPPSQLLDWYESYLDDEEEMDVKAGGGQVMKLGMILRQWMVKLEWFSTLFPRIPVPIQQKIQSVLGERFPIQAVQVATQRDREERKDRHERQEQRVERPERQEQRPERQERVERQEPRVEQRRDLSRDKHEPRESYRRETDDRRERRSGGEKYEKPRDEVARTEYRKERSRDDNSRDDDYYNHKDSSRTREKEEYRERRYRERSPQPQGHRERSPYREREREREPRDRERERAEKHHQHAGKEREHRHKRHH